MIVPSSNIARVKVLSLKDRHVSSYLHVFIYLINKITYVFVELTSYNFTLSFHRYDTVYYGKATNLIPSFFAYLKHMQVQKQKY